MATTEQTTQPDYEPKKEYGFISCRNCKKAVLLFQNKAWMCAGCGHGSLFPIDESRIQIIWLSKDEAELKVGYGCFLKVDLDDYLNRVVIEE